MALEEYTRKRKFGATPEPRGARTKRGRGDALRFVVQLHHARARHYDFRLEVDGVLRSWAVPKGPSFRVGEKRLAVEVEDHPMSYGNFEGEIPEGNYGAGHVAIFDHGVWIPEQDAAESVERGKIDFELRGERLLGRWKLVRTSDKSRKPQWLLLKRDDEHAGDFEADDLLGAPRARKAAKGQGMPESASRGSSRATVPARKPAAPKKPEGISITDRAALIGEALALEGATRRSGASVPFAPMLASVASSPPRGEDWLHEWKWDGYRLTAVVAAGKVHIASRNGLAWHARLPHLAEALQSLGVDAALDGELVALDRNGHSNFNALQRILKSGITGDLSYVLFDLTALGPADLREVKLIDRKGLLQKLLLGCETHLGYSEHIVGHGEAVFEAATKQGLEGILCKQVASPYAAGRSQAWRKVKAVETREFVIVGYTRPKGSRTGLGALLLAEPQGKSWKYVGRVGSGLSDAHLEALPGKLRAASKGPGVELPAHVPLKTRDVHWVVPETVVEVAFRGWGKEGLLRQASFLRVREDREADDTLAVARAIPQPSSPDRIVYPDAGITKQQVFEYYLSVADRLLEEIGGRPLSILRCPDGIAGPHFFQKHAGPGFGDSVKRIQLREKDGGRGEYFHFDDIEGLMNLVQMNALEFHPWGSRVGALEHPDRLVFDLDPDAAIEWRDIRTAAVELRDRLRLAGLESWPKLSGGKGIHVVVPLDPVAKWPAVRAFSEAFAKAMATEQPDRFVATASKVRRRGRIFIDWLRNGRGATSISSWSLRAREGAPVAVPMTWESIARVRSPSRYTLRDAAGLEVSGLMEKLIARRQHLPTLD